MFNFIEKLRQKPESSKTLIAFSFSFLFAGTIFLVWLTVVLPDIRQDQEIKDKVAKIEPSPFSTFFGNVANSFSALKSQVTDVTSKISEMSNTSVYYNNSSVKTGVATSSADLVTGDNSTTTKSVSETASSTTKIGE